MKRSMISVGLLQNRRRGVSGIFLMSILSSLLLVAVVSTYTKVGSLNRQTYRTLDYKGALAMAEAGAERGIAELNRTSGQWTSWVSAGADYTRSETLRDNAGSDFGSFAVSVSKADTELRTIVATGTVAGPAGTIKRTVRVQAKKQQKRSPFGEFGLYSRGSIVMAVGVAIDSYDSSLGLYNVNGNKSSKAAVGAKNDVIMAVLALIKGNLQTGGGVLNLILTAVTGTVTQHSQPTPPPDFPDDEMNAAKTVNNNAAVTVYNKTLLGGRGASQGTPLSGASKLLTLNANQIAVFPPGTYYLEGLTVGASSDIEVQPAGNVTIYLNGLASVSALSKFNANTKDPKNFSLFSNNLISASGVIFDFYGGLYAPEASLSAVAAGTKLYGALVVGTIAFAGLVEVHQDLALAKPIDAVGYLPWNWTESAPL